jgi:hypothetical protein
MGIGAIALVVAVGAFISLSAAVWVALWPPEKNGKK